MGKWRPFSFKKFIQYKGIIIIIIELSGINIFTGQIQSQGNINTRRWTIPLVWLTAHCRVYCFLKMYVRPCYYSENFQTSFNSTLHRPPWSKSPWRNIQIWRSLKVWLTMCLYYYTFTGVKIGPMGQPEEKKFSLNLRVSIFKNVHNQGLTQ